MPPPILIVGAGPTGLLLAIWLQALHTPYLLIDRSSTPGQTSRALVIHARTLEYYAQLGIASAIIAVGDKVERSCVRQGGALRVSVPLGDMGEGLSGYPYALSVPQDVHERVLEEELGKRGGEVKRGLELIGCEDMGDKGMNVRLRKIDGRNNETVLASYIAGCDGAHSAVRKLAGIEMMGGTYTKRFFVADVDVKGDLAGSSDINVCFTGTDFCLYVPLRQRSGGARLVGIVPERIEAEEVRFEDVADAVESGSGLDVTRVGWFSTYRVHHRVAQKFRDGRFFLVGDAAHLHSPVGGQGMNTGLGDASNLGWKLASVMKDEKPSDSIHISLLDSYEVERQKFAKALVKTTDRWFTLITDAGIVGKLVRNMFVPYIWPLIFYIPGVPRFVFKRLSQILIEYRDSSLSEGVVGTIHAGDRLPYVRLDDSDNHTVLSTLRWQTHVYGDATGSVKDILQGKRVPLHTFPYTKSAGAAGLEQDALYLIRPDGHVGLACLGSDDMALESYLGRLNIN